MRCRLIFSYTGKKGIDSELQCRLSYTEERANVCFILQLRDMLGKNEKERMMYSMYDIDLVAMHLYNETNLF